jgi:hypothetical protein
MGRFEGTCGSGSIDPLCLNFGTIQAKSRVPLLAKAWVPSQASLFGLKMALSLLTLCRPSNWQRI